MKSSAHLIVKTLVFTMLILSLVGCSQATPQTIIATQDPAQVVNMVVGTLNAQQTDEALRNPTATNAPTSTPEPTQTPEPPATPTLAETATPEASATPEATATQPVPAISALPLYASTYPGNKREYTPNEGFGLALGFQNNGTVTWEPGYYVEVVAFEGEVTVQNGSTSKSVEPGQKVEFDLPAFGSETIGKHVWYFQLYTSSGVPVPGGYISFSYTSVMG